MARRNKLNTTQSYDEMNQPQLTGLMSDETMDEVSCVKDNEQMVLSLTTITTSPATNLDATALKNEEMVIDDIILTATNLKSSDVMKPEMSDEVNVMIHDETPRIATLGVYKVYNDVILPKYQTEKSACFDITAYLGDDIRTVVVYNRLLMQFNRTIINLMERGNSRGIQIEAGDNVYIPTGIIFNIPPGYKLNFYPRSGLASKQHLKLANCVGIIDEDFVTQSFILLHNDSGKRQSIIHGERIAQVEIVPIVQAQFELLEVAPVQKSTRNGGFGSTGGMG